MRTYHFENVWNRVKSVTGWKKQLELSDFLGITSSSISAPKRREAFPVDWALRIAERYNVSTDWLLRGVGQKYIITGALPGKGDNVKQPAANQRECDTEAEARPGSNQVPQGGSLDSEEFELKLRSLIRDELNKIKTAEPLANREVEFDNEELQDIDAWLTELVKNNPKRKEWFALTFEDAFPSFGPWRKRRCQARKDSSASVE